MGGTRQGGLQAVKKIKAKFGEDHYARIGSIGGSTSYGAPKGFARMTPEERSAAGTKGGRSSKRKPATA